jgi:SET domain
MITNAFRATLADDTPIGLCFEPILALANHSCSPNAVVVFDGRSVALRALEPIVKGEQVFISYITATEDRASRQRDLTQRYFFDCQCEKCSKDESPYSTFLRYVPKTEGRVDMLCSSEYLIRNAEAVVGRHEQSGGHIDFSKATSYLQQSQAIKQYAAEKIKVLKKAAYSCDPDRSEFAFHPIPNIMHEIYLKYLGSTQFLEALIILLFIFLDCDVYNYPQQCHPVRTIRMLSIARLLKHLSRQSPLSNKTTVKDSKLQLKLSSAICSEAIEDFDWINTAHAVMILVWEQAPKSHGKDSRFMREVEAELRDVEEAKRPKREVGERLREWMSDANSAGGKLEAQSIMEALRKLKNCAWELLATTA